MEKSRLLIFKPWIIIIMLCLSTTSYTLAQLRVTGFSISPKGGLFLAHDVMDGLGGSVELQFRLIYGSIDDTKPITISADYGGGSEFEIFYTKKPHQGFYQTSFKIGQVRINNKFSFQYQTGLSLVWGTKRGEYIETINGFFGHYNLYEKINYNTIGLPLEVGVQYLPSRYFGLGVQLVANINSKFSTFMPLLTLHFGILRP